jgi:hypothetical protein
MKIMVLGARGDVGSRVVSEALSRDHDVTAIVRNRDQVETLPSSVTAEVADVQNTDRLADLMAGHDLAISALRPPDGREELLVPLTRCVLDAAAHSEVRALLVGGAASLRLPHGDGTTVLTAPGFLPEAVMPIARACQEQYELCTAERQAQWSYLCPPTMLVPGERSGRYKLGSDVLLVDDAGESRISMEDFAVALIDEAEQPQHLMTRFTVAN